VTSSLSRLSNNIITFTEQKHSHWTTTPSLNDDWKTSDDNFNEWQHLYRGESLIANKKFITNTIFQATTIRTRTKKQLSDKKNINIAALLQNVWLLIQGWWQGRKNRKQRKNGQKLTVITKIRTLLSTYADVYMMKVMMWYIHECSYFICIAISEANTFSCSRSCPYLRAPAVAHLHFNVQLTFEMNADLWNSLEGNHLYMQRKSTTTTWGYRHYLLQDTPL
jgi:hypothetical protein